MSRRFAESLAFAAVTLSCFSAQAAEPAATGGTSSISASRNVPFNGLPPWAGFAALTSILDSAESVNIYSLRGQSGSKGPGGPVDAYWIMRRAIGHDDTVTSVRWADSRVCPVMIAVLNQMSDLTPPRLEIPGLRPYAGPMPIPPLDGTTYTVWSHASVQPGGAYGSVMVSSNDGLIADFGRYASKTLASCWREEEPLVSSPVRP